MPELMMHRKVHIFHLPFHRRICFFLLIILHTFSFSLHAQSVRDITTSDGLPQSFVSGLVQDDTSFIWIGTRNGLARFDGTQFKVYKHSTQDTNSLASNLIIWIQRDAANNLWIEHESGVIDKMNPATDQITHYLTGNGSSGNSVQFIRRGWLVTQDGIFWGIRKGAGLNNFNVRTGKLNVFTKTNSALRTDTIRGIAEAEGGGLWTVDQKGISYYDPRSAHFINWPIPYPQDYGNFPESDAIAIDLHKRINGELMWGDRRNLFFFNPKTHTYRFVAMPALAYMGVRWFRTSYDSLDYIEQYGQVYRYSDRTGLTSIGKTIRSNFGDVKSFLVDRSGLIWMGTNAEGIHVVNLEVPFFQSKAYTKDFSTDVLQQEMGIHLQQDYNWNETDNLFSAPGYHFRSVYDRNRKLYLALKETVIVYDIDKKNFYKLPHVPVDIAPGERGIGIKGITINAQNEPMIVGYSGLVVQYDSATKTWKDVIDPTIIRKKMGAALLPQDIYTDEENIWITTAGDGLIRINKQTKEIQQLKERAGGSVPSNQLLGLRPDMKNPDLLWIGSYQGLIGLNKKTMTYQLFSTSDGIPDNTIYSILTDRLGNLWLSTNKGICRFDPVTHQVRAFKTQHGLPGDEFNRFHHLELPDGRLAFGGTAGWTIFDPLLIKNDVFEPVLALTDLKLNNKTILPSKDSGFLRLPINTVSQLVFPYEQNSITISYAGLEFGQPQDLEYRYQLSGYDNDWVYAGNSRQAIYTKLPPGNYTLMVNASNTTGIWSSHVKTVRLRIEHPWWSTKMAFLCYFIIVAGLAWTFIRFRVSRMLMKQEMDLKEREASQLKELDDMKTKFFSNITHEFRTPLTLILGPAEQLKSTFPAGSKNIKLTDTIVNNAKQLLTLINRLMDLSKLEAKALQLHEQRGNPADAVGSVVHSFESDAQSKNIQLRFEDRTQPMDCWFFADALERIVYNLISNSLKFTPAGGRVNVELADTDSRLLLTIQDTGTGISKEELPHIFDRFYQAGEAKRLSNEAWNSGTGIGLSLVRELVNQMKGTMDVESRSVAEYPDRSGTAFTIQMPYRTSDETHSTGLSDPEISERLMAAGENEKQQQVLLVEDSIELAGFIKGILSETYEVTHVLNGELGLEAALSLMPDLIVSDVMMPVMDGYEMCRRIKEDIRTSHIPVILLTAKVSQENLIEGLLKGADDYLTKPFHPTELLLRMHNLLERQQKLRDRIRTELSLPDAIPAEETPQDIFVTRLYEVLDEHLDDEGFGVDQLVGAIHMSRSSLHRKLKALTGLSTTEVVRNYRLKKATYFLKEGHSSSDTAYKTGFGSPAYFTKSFREVYGLTPGDYVKKHKN